MTFLPKKNYSCQYLSRHVLWGSVLKSYTDTECDNDSVKKIIRTTQFTVKRLPHLTKFLSTTTWDAILWRFCSVGALTLRTLDAKENEPVIFSCRIQIRYFAQKLQFFTPPQTKICQFLSFFLQTSVKIFMASLKWREALENFPFLTHICAKKTAKGAKRRNFYTLLHDIM